jgi:DNA primase catalytic core
MDGSAFRDFVERVRESTDILEVIGQRVSLDRHHKGLCPFRPETTPSLSVNPEGRYWHCFGCGAGGDVFKFLELFEEKLFMTVLLELAQRAGIPVPAGDGGEGDRIREERQIEDVLAATADFYHRGLPPKAKAYLIGERGFTEETISRFRIGYAGGGLREHLTGECSFSVDVCLKAGVLKQVSDGGVADYFHDRIIFPNLRRGRVVHLSGRRIDGGDPKYLHLPGEIRYLYNEDALLCKEAIVTEGVADCISATQAGYAAVATLGTSGFKPEYLSKFSRCDRVNICFDGDEAGRQGAVKVARLIGSRARIVELPDGADLNDFLKAHLKDEFQALVASAKDSMQYQISLIPAEVGKVDLLARLEPLLAELAPGDPARAEAYLCGEIKPRFKLAKAEVDAYRALINKGRKAAAKLEAGKEETGDSKEVYTAVLDGLVDVVEHDGQPGFLMKQDNQLVVLPEVKRDGVTYRPPPREQIPWLLPRADEVLNLYDVQQMLPPGEVDAALYDDLVAYHKAISELPAEEYYDLIAAWDLHTYLPETVQYTPIVCLFAVPERGKSRTGKGMIYVAYRGLHVESLRDPYIVRVANDLRASLFFDVKDIWRKAEKNGSEDILLLRFEKGAVVPRVLYPDRGAHRDIVYYSIFGPTIIGTNEVVHRILETRAVSINMPETVNRFENDVTPEGALGLKERLVVFRARHLGEVLPDMPKPASGRLGDILKPLMQIVRLARPEREDWFLGLVREIEAERMVEKADSLEAQILRVVVRLADKVSNGVLANTLITDTLNEGRSERAKLGYKRVAGRLSAMGFKKGCTGGGAMAVIWDDRLVERLIQAYGVRQTSGTSEWSESSAGEVAGTDLTDVSDDTDVLRSGYGGGVSPCGSGDAQGTD